MVYEFLLDDRKTNSRLVAICLASILLNVAAFAEQQTPLDKVRTLRLQGKLPEAKSLAERQVERNFDHRHVAISFHLELARIHDRIGLHNNTRPVVAALAHIDTRDRIGSCRLLLSCGDVRERISTRFSIRTWCDHTISEYWRPTW